MSDKTADRMLAEYRAARRAAAKDHNRVNQLEADLELNRPSREHGRGLTASLDRDAGGRLQRELEATQRSATAHAEAAARAEQELRDHWLAQGRSPAELTRLLRETDYSETVGALFSGRTMLVGSRDYTAAVKVQKSAAEELRAFWVTSGHDLRELRKFMSAVDVQVQAVVPK